MVAIFKSIDKNSKQSLHEQLLSQFIGLIQNGILKPNQKLPSSRKLSEQLGVHRKTVVKVIDELVLQGWVVTKPAQGTYISEKIKDYMPKSLNGLKSVSSGIRRFEIPDFKKNIGQPVLTVEPYHFDDGLPDPRIAPLKELGNAYNQALNERNPYKRLAYVSTKGSLRLRKAISCFLNESRGLAIGEHQVMITRGITQAFFLACKALLREGDFAAVGALNWQSANSVLLNQGIQLLKLEVDDYGIVLDKLEDYCKKYPLKLIYVTPHHHYPTTVIMPAERRMQLLQLSRKYGFIIFEDDYDYDFHFAGTPLFPMASVNPMANVLYAGSFTKAISPGIRVGYLVGDENLIEHISIARRMVDRQGDEILENALAALIEDGIIGRCLRKARRTYLARRDFFIQTLKSDFQNEIQFQTPEGGMAVWATFDQKINMRELAKKTKMKGLYISDGIQQQSDLNATRLGFASSTEEELAIGFEILKSALK